MYHDAHLLSILQIWTGLIFIETIKNIIVDSRHSVVSRRLLYMKEVVIHVAVHMNRLRPAHLHSVMLCVYHWADWDTNHCRLRHTTAEGLEATPHGISHYATCTSLSLSKTLSEILIKRPFLFKMTTRAVLRKACKVLSDQNEIPFPWTISVWCTVPSLDA